MPKKQTTKTVQFANLSQDHKTQFIQFLIKNNICFQQGKQNCTAKVSLKSTKSPHTQTEISHPLQQARGNKQSKIRETNKSQNNTKKPLKIQTKPLQNRNDILNRQNISQSMSRQIKTPRKEQPKELKEPKELKGSSLKCKGRSLTGKKGLQQTPRNHLSMRKSINPKSLTKNINSSSKKLKEQQIVPKNSKQKLEASQQRQKQNMSLKIKPKTDVSRERVVNKYAKLFDLCQKGRAIRWPTNLLQRTIQQIYDDIFTRNTQCLQNKNINHALKTLTQITFPQLVESYFRKKFKGSKLAATNLNNMLYTLSSLISKEGCPVFIKTFQDFLLSEWQHQDLLYYLFARNVLKRQLRVNDKGKDLNRAEGCYFIETLKGRDISKCLLGIIGKDSQLLSQYKQLLVQQLGTEHIQAYQFLKVLLEDYHAKRVGNKLSLGSQSLGQTLFQKDNSYDARNNTEQLTFGEDHEQQKQSLMQRCSQFWGCQEYSRIKDSLFDLIMQKMAQKVIQLVELLAHDIEVPAYMLQTLEQILLRKAESLVKAVFEMNKMKWFKQLAIVQPTDQDMNNIQGVQIRLRELRSNPSGRQIGQFCKNILTTKALVNELELALMINE